MENNSSEQQTKGNKKKKGACFKKAWRAIKATFSRSRKDEVVPFSAPSDLDPSDLQRDPYVQTNLRVFESRGLQDHEGFLPGLCNGEQMHLEDLKDTADPQEGPSGLEPTAPEQLDEHQPEQQTKTQKKKKGASFKRAWRAIKGTFSRSQKKKGAHSPSQSDHAASDLHPDPFGQTNNLKTSSKLKSPAPRNPSDSQPASQQRKRRKKKGAFKRAWWAIKGSFSRPRKGKVVPFSAPSDLDVSDLHPDPYVQTNLRVFKSTDFHELDDLLPGSCNLEKTHLEDFKDPTDPQEGQFGHETTVPEEPADSQPARSFSLLYEGPTLMSNPIGQGCYGVVFEGTRRSDGLKVAIKFIFKGRRGPERYIKISGYPEPLPAEVAIYLHLQKSGKCPYIVKMLDWFEEEKSFDEQDCIIIIMEFPQPCKNLDLFMLDYPDGLGETLGRDLMRQIVTAAKYCLDNGVSHQDLKTQNILINPETLQIKLIDFGVSELISTSSERIVAEQCTVEDLCFLLFSILCGWKQDIGSVSEESRDLIKRCCFFTQANTPTFEEFMNHEWFKQG